MQAAPSSMGALAQAEAKMIEETRLLDTFLELVRIDSPSGEEERVSRHLEKALADLGLEVERDAMHNLVGRLAGNGEPVLLAAHMDTVTPGSGAAAGR